MLDINLLTKILVVLGGVGGTSFLVIGNVEQISNPQKEWISKISNSGGEILEFKAQNNFEKGQLEGEWQLLSTETGKEKTIEKEAIIDLAVRKKTTRKIYAWEHASDKEIRLLKCLGEKSDGGQRAVNKQNNQELYCQDLGKEWYYGWIGNEAKRVSFVIKKEIMEGKTDNWEIFDGKLDNLNSNMKEPYKKIVEWIQKNVLEANLWTTIKAKVNTTNGMCNKIATPEIAKRELCFMLGGYYEGTMKSKAGATGGDMSRPEMKNLLQQLLENQRDKVFRL